MPAKQMQRTKAAPLEARNALERQAQQNSSNINVDDLEQFLRLATQKEQYKAKATAKRNHFLAFQEFQTLSAYYAELANIIQLISSNKYLPSVGGSANLSRRKKT